MKKVFIAALFLLCMMQLWGYRAEKNDDGTYTIDLMDISINISGGTKTHTVTKEAWLFEYEYQEDHFYIGVNPITITVTAKLNNIVLYDYPSNGILYEYPKSLQYSVNSEDSKLLITYLKYPHGVTPGPFVSYSPNRCDVYLYFDKDLTPPEVPSVSFPNKSSNDWYNPEKTNIDFSLSGGSDTESGFDHYEYKITKNEGTSNFTTCQSSFTFTEKDNGQYIISFYAVDIVGNKSEPATYNINLDSEFPVIDEKNLSLGTEQKYVKKADIDFSVYDENLSSCEYRIYQNDESNKEWITVPVSNGTAVCKEIFTTTGILILEIKTSDKAGNEVKKEFTVYIDSVPPQITVNSVDITDSKEQKTIISIEATADDNDKSGIYSFLTNEEFVNEKNISTSSTEQRRDEKFTTEINRRETIINKLYKLEAKDICGNYSDLTVIFTKIPKRLVLTSFSSTIEGDYIVNKIKTNLSSKDEIDSYQLSYSRRFTVIDSSENLDFLEEQIKEVNVTKDQTVLEDDGLYILDRIPTSTGLGHHEVKYTFQCKTIYSYKIGDGSETNKVFDDYLDISALAINKCFCANNPCKITWKITGRKEELNGSQGEQQSIEIDGSDSSIENKEFQIDTNPNSTVTISVRIEDLDFERHDIQLFKYLYLGSDRELNNKTNLIKIPVENMIIKDYRTYKIDSNNYRSDGFYEFHLPVYPTFNKTENYGLEIVEYVEQKDTNQVVTKSEIVALEAISDLGGFKLNVSSNADYDANGISIQVNTPLKMIIEELNTTGDSYLINWGDEKAPAIINVKNGEVASHVYGQKKDRTGAISEYKLKIETNNNSKSMPVSSEITVNAVDTQYGELAGDEVWIGNHQILSSITIPEDRKLTINGSVPETEKENEKVQICIYGNSDNSEEGGSPAFINVKGTLNTTKETDGILFTEMHNDSNYGFIANTTKTYGWGGIFAHPESKVMLSNVIINFANRGIIALGESDVTILKSSIQYNDVGIHAFENSNVTVNDSTISNNVIYGIKEEKASKDIVKLTDGNNLNTNLIENNGSVKYPRNHYKATSGLENLD